MILLCAICVLGGFTLVPDWTPKEPEVLPEIESYLRVEHERFVHEQTMHGFDDIDESLRFLREFMSELRDDLGALFGEETSTQNLLFIRAEADATHPDDLSYRVFLSGILAKPLMESTRKQLEAIAPYWPPENPILMENIERLFFWPIARTEGQPDRFNTDFSVFTEVLSNAWENDNHAYDGLIDYMFECNAIMAWLAMLEMEGVDEDERDEFFQKLIATSHPYGGYYRDKPDRLPAGSREGLHELLMEYSRDDSLWARVFAAEVLNKVPYMRDPEIEATLREDPHWLIQRRMAYLDDEEGSDSD